MIRLTVPSIDEDDLEAVRQTLESGFLVQGARVVAFEEAVAAYVGTKYAVAVSNGTAALHLSLLALGIGPGDRVAVTAYSFPATANAIVLCGADPVFVDIRPDTFNMDPDALAKTLSSVRVKAILPVHTFGGMADMPAILGLANQYGVPVIEDAACALGSDLDGRRAGSWGVMGCFSFHPRKAITTGEGGMITTNDPSLVCRLRALRNHGLDPEAASPDFILAGHNMRLTEFQAALGSSQMNKLERIVAARQAGAARYDRLLEGSGVHSPRFLPKSRHVYQSYVVLVPHGSPSLCRETITHLRSRGVEATIGTYHMPMTTYFRARTSCETGWFPVSDDIASRALSLPLYERMEVQDQEYVAAVLRSCLTESQGAR